jgi:hypothetical protein
MQVLTTESVREHLTPGDSVRDARNVVHTVFKVLHTGYGFAGTLLTSWSNGNGYVGYGVWVITSEGAIRNTMATGDFAAAHNAFAARVGQKLRAETGTAKGETA